MINLITGLGRCGTSLAMQMGDAAGWPMTGEYPWYEPRQTVPKTYSKKWLSRQDGKFVKLLFPLQFELPDNEYRFLFLIRDPVQQFMSIMKLQRANGRKLSIMLDQGVANVIKNQAKSYDMIRQLGDVHVMRFEDLLMYPLDCAGMIAQHFRLSADLDRMAAVVKDRESTVAETMEHAESTEKLRA